MRCLIALAALLLIGAGTAGCAGSRPVAPPEPQAGENEFGAEVLSYRWNPGLTFDRLKRAQYLWTARVHNATPQPRKICVTFELLSETDAVLASNAHCEVVRPHADGDVTNNAYLPAKVLAQAKAARATATESHRLYYPAPPPKTAKR